MARSRLGLAVVTDEAGRVLGVFSEGDLLRALDARTDLHATQVDAVMTRECTTVTGRTLAAEAARLMQDRHINAMPVTDEDGRLTGVFNMQDLLGAKIL